MPFQLLKHKKCSINFTRCKAKADVSRPGYYSRLCPLTSMHYSSLYPATHMRHLSCMLPPSGEYRRNSVTQFWDNTVLWLEPKNGCHGNVPRVIEKTNFKLIILSHGSTNPDNLAKIGPVDICRCLDNWPSRNR